MYNAANSITNICSHATSLHIHLHCATGCCDAWSDTLIIVLCMLQQANLLLMDSVAGVGYSYSMDPNDYTTNDTQAQTDIEATLRSWFQLYPYFANHSVILEGASSAIRTRNRLAHVAYAGTHCIRTHCSLTVSCTQHISAYMGFNVTKHTTLVYS